MSTAPTAPVAPIFQYNFEDVNGKLTDLSGNGFDITLPTSGVASVNDPVMGSCLQFLGTDEGHLTIPKLPYTGVSDLSAGVTISMWVNADTFAHNTTPILLNVGGTQEIPGTRTSVANDIGLRLNGMTPYFNRDYADLAAKEQGSASLNSTESITAGDWVHLAVTVDHLGCATFYKGGVAQAAKTNPDFIPSAPTTPISGNIGASIGDTVPPFNGMIGWLAMYNGVLSPSEIKREMELGQSNRYFVSNRSFPMDFKLFSNDAGADSPIMFIDSAGIDQILDFHIVNTSKKPLSIPIGSGTVDATSNYHFQLRFRPGILSENYIKKHTTTGTGINKVEAEPLLASTSWSTLLSKDASNNDVMSFLYIGDAAKAIDVGKEFVLHLEDINASATGGSKNTNVAFKYQGINYGSSDHKIEGYRSQNISIVNHTGDKNIPLRAEIAGMASVMTYHQANGVTAPTSELMFHLINTGTEPLSLGTATSDDGATTFTLSVDVQPENEFMDWALFAQDAGDPAVVMDVIGVVRSFDGSTITLRTPLTEALDANTPLQIVGVTDTVTVGTNGAKAGAYTIVLSTTTTQPIADGAVITPTTGQGAWTVKPLTDAPPNQMQWTITNNSTQSFAVGNGLSFLLKGIECSLPAGSSTIIIGYANIPNHWDGSFALDVQKSPVAYNENLMGINTKEPKANLHIVEEVGSVPFRIQKKGATGNLIPATADGTLSNNSLNFSRIYLLDEETSTYIIPVIDANDTGDFILNTWSPTSPKGSKITFSNTSGADTYNNHCVYYAPYLVISKPTLGNFDVYKFVGGETLFTYLREVSGNTWSDSNEIRVCFYNDFMLYGGDGSDGSTFLTAFDLDSQNLSKSYFSTSGSSIGHMVIYDGYIYYSSYNGTSGISVKTFALDSTGLTVGNDTTQVSGFENLTVLGPFTVYGSYLYSPVKDSTGKISVAIVHMAGANSTANTKPLIPGYDKKVCLDNNRLYAGGNNGIAVYDITQPGSMNHLYSMNFNSPFYLENMGVTSGIFWFKGSGSVTGGNSEFINVFHLQKLLMKIFGQNTLVSSDKISIGNLQPEPTGGGLSITVDSESDLVPIEVSDHEGNSIFNIVKQAPTDESYRVGIGTDNPKAGLHVSSYRNVTVSGFGILAKNGASTITHPGASSPYTSIYADHYIMATEFFAFSDLRIKDAVNPSVHLNDLNTLLKIQISDYEYIDFINKGTGQKKGLIAQQVKEVFPQAVSAENTDFIPDIYAMTTDLSWQPLTKQLRVSLEMEHDLTVGDKLRLIADQGFEEKEVVAIPDCTSFVVADWEKPVEKLFVFGKEVHDFHTVDYDQVAMLGVSAIQALHAEVETLKKENESLKTQMQWEMAELKAEWAAFKSSLTQQHQN